MPNPKLKNEQPNDCDSPDKLIELHRGKKFLAELARPNQKFPEVHRQADEVRSSLFAKPKAAFSFGSFSF